MKVKELFDILKNTKFTITAKRYKGNTLINGSEEMIFSLSNFGLSSYGGHYENTFCFKIYDNRNLDVCKEEKKYNCLSSIDESLLEMSVNNIEKINLYGDIKQSSSGNGYYDNTSTITIKVY